METFDSFWWRHLLVSGIVVGCHSAERCRRKRMVQQWGVVRPWLSREVHRYFLSQTRTLLVVYRSRQALPSSSFARAGQPRFVMEIQINIAVCEANASTVENRCQCLPLSNSNDYSLKSKTIFLFVAGFSDSSGNESDRLPILQWTFTSQEESLARLFSPQALPTRPPDRHGWIR